MLLDEVRFELPGELDYYVLIRRGQAPFDPHAKLERVEPLLAARYVLAAVRGCWFHYRWALLHFFDVHDHPTALDQNEVLGWVAHRLQRYDAPDLYRWRARTDYLGQPALPSAPPPRPPQTPVARPRSFVIVEVVSAAGGPLPGVQLEITAPDGSVRTLVTDLYGRAGLDGIDPGSCSIALPRLDRSVWSAEENHGQLASTAPGRPHIVQRGECLSQLAHVHGIADWQTLWDHPDNASLRARRKSPHVLMPGDSVVIPGPRVGKIERATDAIHRITVEQAVGAVELVLGFVDHLGEPLADEPYELTYGAGKQATKRTGRLTGSGELRESVPANLMSAALRLLEREETYTLALGQLDPVLDAGAPIESGAVARLGALGYLTAHTRAPSAEELRAAVALFQREIMGNAEPSGELDPDTCSRLEETHGA